MFKLPSTQNRNNIYDFKVVNNQGQNISLSKYRGKVLSIVNMGTGS
jgi:glutathione peroxidase-family protein